MGWAEECVWQATRLQPCDRAWLGGSEAAGRLLPSSRLQPCLDAPSTPHTCSPSHQPPTCLYSASAFSTAVLSGSRASVTPAPVSQSSTSTDAAPAGILHGVLGEACGLQALQAEAGRMLPTLQLSSPKPCTGCWPAGCAANKLQWFQGQTAPQGSTEAMPRQLGTLPSPASPAQGPKLKPPPVHVGHDHVRLLLRRLVPVAVAALLLQRLRLLLRHGEQVGVGVGAGV